MNSCMERREVPIIKMSSTYIRMNIVELAWQWMKSEGLEMEEWKPRWNKVLLDVWYQNLGACLRP